MRRAENMLSLPVTSSAGLTRLELLSDRQTQSLQALERQVSKMQLKVRLMGHDVKPTLRKVSALSPAAPTPAQCAAAAADCLLMCGYCAQPLHSTFWPVSAYVPSFAGRLQQSSK